MQNKSKNVNSLITSNHAEDGLARQADCHVKLSKVGAKLTAFDGATHHNRQSLIPPVAPTPLCYPVASNNATKSQ